MKIVKGVLVAVGFFVAAAGLARAQEAEKGDAEKGKIVFSQCMACHKLDSNMVGPELKGVIGRRAGSAEGYANYSSLMKTASEAGLTWTDAEIVDYLKNPTEYLTKYDKDKGKEPTGQSRMLFKISSEQKRKDVVAFLASEK